MSAHDRSASRWRRRHRPESKGPPAEARTAEGRPDSAGALAAARGGDLRAWEYLVRGHQEIVFRSAYLVARDWVSAEEAAKSAFVRAYRSLASLEDVAALRPWLLGITATATRIQLRESAQRRDARAVEHHPCPRLPATPTRLAAGVPQPTPQEHGALHDAFDGLADDDRLMLAARYSFGLSRPEAAVRFAMSPDELDGRLAAAVRRLRGRLSDATAATTVRQAPRAVANEGAPRPGRFESLSDDQLGTMTLAVVMSELPWTPDVAPIVCTRLAREAVAYSASSAAPAATMATAQPGSAARQVPSSGRDPAARVRRSGASPVKLAALVVGVSLVGVAFAVGSLGADGPKQLGARVGALLDEPDSGPVTAEEATASVKQPSPGAGDRATSTSLAASSLVPSNGMDEAPRVTIVDAHTLANGDVGARISLDWSPLLPAIGAGAGPGVATETRLERWLEDETWSVVATADAGDPVEVAVGPGRRYLFRVRVLDASGTDAVSAPVGLELDVRDPRSPHLALEPAPDGWITKRGNTIKRRLVATVPDASLSTEFSGSSVALVGPAGPDRGAIGVRIDGGPWSQDDLRTWATAARTLVFSQDLESGPHSLDLRAEADGVALDAVVILRTEEA